jgi:predicted amidohydrolase YtcJ
MSKKILTNANLQIQSNTLIDPKADALVIEDGIIGKIGRSNDLVSQFGEGATVENINGSLLLPSFTDAHIHLLAYGQSLQRVNAEANTKHECLHRMTDQVQSTPPGKWIVGHGWDHNVWAEGYGSKKDLDALSDHHPIYLTHKSLHSGWVNSLALERAGIRSGTRDPENGKIQRDDFCEPTGIVFEGAMKLVESVIPRPSNSERKTAILKAQSTLHKYGITAVHDFDPWSVHESLVDLQKNGSLSLRVIKGIPEANLDAAIDAGLKSGDGDDWVKIGWLKLFADGALGPQTAAMLTPYENSDSIGMLFLPKEDIIAIGEKALPHGIAMAIHAIGDKAVRESLHALSHLDIGGLLHIPQLRSRIEHVQIFNHEDIHLFAKHDILASMQPIHAISDMEMAEIYWGMRCSNSYAWKSISQINAQLIFGSDAPVESPNPFLGLHAAVLRMKLGNLTEKSASWIPEQCLNLQSSINAYTTTPSRVGGFSNKSGQIKEGYFADFVVLPEDFFSKSINDIQFTTPLATMSGGKWVYKNDTIGLEIN